MPRVPAPDRSRWSGTAPIKREINVTYRWKLYATAATFAAALAVAGCGEEKKEEQAAAPAATEQPATGTQTAATETPAPAADPMAALVEAAKKEGQLTTIALP